VIRFATRPRRRPQADATAADVMLLTQAFASCSLVLLFFVTPPLTKTRGGRRVSKDRTPKASQREVQYDPCLSVLIVVRVNPRPQR
jgi:hypothetical protein